jgi:hypothetical protein
MSNPVHRSTTERSITRQNKVAPLSASEKTKHQPHCGSGVAAIKNVRRFLQTIKTNPLNGHNFSISMGEIVVPIERRQAAVLIGSSAGKSPSMVVLPRQ